MENRRKILDLFNWPILIILVTTKGDDMETDPVCKMEVDPKTAQWTLEYKQKAYYFCSPGCKRSFEKDPELYLSGKAPVIKMD